MMALVPARRPLLAALALLAATGCSSTEQQRSAPAAQGAADVPGVTATEIRVGVEDINLVSATVTPGGTSRGPAQDYTEALFADLNAKGGVGGRRLVPVFHTYQVPNYPSFLDQEQAACAHYTEDAKVAVVIGQSFQHSENFLACLSRRNVPFLESGFALHLAKTFERFPLYFTVASPERAELNRAMVDRLHERGFLPPGSKVGTVGFDGPDTAEHVQVLRDALARHRLELAKVVTVPRPLNPAEQQASAANAVLQLKEAGVDRIVGAVVVEQIMRTAETQGYRPLYAMQSSAGLSNLPRNVPVEQLRGAQAIGWVPVVDVDAGRDPGAWPARQRCLDVMASAGIKLSDRNAERGAMTHCDVVWLLAAAADGAKGKLDAASLRMSIEQLGTSFQPASTVAARFGPDRHAGVAAVRTLAFDEECRCFTYTSGELPLR